MHLTWRDAVTTGALVAMLSIYFAYLGGGVGLLRSAWATAAVLLLLGLAGRVVSVRGEPHARPQERFHAVLQATATVLGVLALISGLTAVIADSGYALKLLVMTSIATWTTVSLSHV